MFVDGEYVYFKFEQYGGSGIFDVALTNLFKIHSIKVETKNKTLFLKCPGLF